MTATELSQELNIGAVGVRQHLALLERDNLVKVVGLRRSIGRPSHLYTLTAEAEQCFPKSYDRLALNVLNYISHEGGEEAVTDALSLHRQKIQQMYAGRLTGKSRSEQVAELSNILNEQGHMCEYEQQDDGSYTITVHNCPVDCVARQYNQICMQELELYRDLIGLPLERDHTIAEGDLYCRYVIPA
jgi:predicted ArsR family transcriptional regulator